MRPTALVLFFTVSAWSQNTQASGPLSVGYGEPKRAAGSLETQQRPPASSPPRFQHVAPTTAAASFMLRQTMRSDLGLEEAFRPGELATPWMKFNAEYHFKHSYSRLGHGGFFERMAHAFSQAKANRKDYNTRLAYLNSTSNATHVGPLVAASVHRYNTNPFRVLRNEMQKPLQRALWHEFGPDIRKGSLKGIKFVVNKFFFFE